MKEFTAVVTLKLDIPVKAIDMARAERECRLMVEQLKLLLMRAGVEGVTVSRMAEPSEAIKRARQCSNTDRLNKM